MIVLLSAFLKIKITMFLLVSANTAFLVLLQSKTA